MGSMLDLVGGSVDMTSPRYVGFTWWDSIKKRDSRWGLYFKLGHINVDDKLIWGFHGSSYACCIFLLWVLTCISSDNNSTVKPFHI